MQFLFFCLFVLKYLPGSCSLAEEDTRLDLHGKEEQLSAGEGLKMGFRGQVLAQTALQAGVLGGGTTGWGVVLRCVPATPALLKKAEPHKARPGEGGAGPV